ncbi:MAG: 16S rRNA (cytidine(1402)-2'-O)-methyltransferase [Clostridia bacterium]|nr:16S rRNA (cytidine(1402)-2'-O)-methyltransferase [Clostridia bacterium]
MAAQHVDEEKNRILPKTLYLVATPIGNLADLSPRAVKVLSQVDFIAAEDTRNTQKLLSCFGISGKELISYFEHNKRQKGEYILSRMEAGESCALVTDAGTPAISDPGEDLVRLCAERQITVTGIPGCCAAVNALSLSALATGRFAFEGFLSVNKGERKKRLEEIQNERRTMIFYEAPHKLKATLDDLAACFGGERKITLCRELTKLNEELIYTTLAGAVALYGERAPKGEYVLILAGLDECPDTDAKKDNPLCALSPEEHLAHYEAKGLAKMDAMKAAAKDRGISKSDFYRMLHQ